MCGLGRRSSRVSNPRRNVWNQLPEAPAAHGRAVSNPRRNVWNVAAAWAYVDERTFQIPEGTFGTFELGGYLGGFFLCFKSQKERLEPRRPAGSSPGRACFKSQKERLELVIRTHLWRAQMHLFQIPEGTFGTACGLSPMRYSYRSFKSQKERLEPIIYSKYRML